MSRSIADYFEYHLDTTHTDRTLSDLPLDSNCGDDCRKAIDAASELLRHLEASCPNGEHRINIIAAVEHIVSVYWHG